MRNFRFYIFILIFAFCFFILLPKTAEAGLIVQRPLYLGLDSGLVGYWTFDQQDMSGERAYDKSGNGNTGLLTNGPVRKAGRIGQALNFDAVNDVVNAGSDTSLDDIGPMTVSAWIKAESVGESNGGRIVDKSAGTGPTNGWTFLTCGVNTCAVGVSGASRALSFLVEYSTTDLARVSANDVLTLSAWQHVIATWDGSATAANVHLYINGQEVSYQLTQDAVGTRNTDNLQDFRIGNEAATTRTFNGLIDDVRIYNRALSADEIKRLYNIGATLKLGSPKPIGLDNGLVGYWTFDGTDMAGERAYDKSGNGNTGLLTNGPIRKAGRIGQALEFDGVNDSVAMGDKNIFSFGDASSDNPLSISAWVRSNNIATTQNIVAKWYNWGTRQREYRLVLISGKVRLELADDSNPDTYVYIGRTYNTALQRNIWYHVVATYNGSADSNGIDIYLNGIMVDDANANTGTGYVAMHNMTSGLNIGNALEFGVNQFFPGLLDDVRIYNRALSPDEIKRLYNIGATLKLGSPKPIGLDNGLVGYWTFDGQDMAGERAYDKSGNGNTGLLTNGPTRKAGRIGQALNFDGVDDFVEIPKSTSLDNLPALSVSFWMDFKGDPLVNVKYGIISRSRSIADGWGIEKMNAVSRIRFEVDYSTTDLQRISASDVIDNNGWHHYVVTWDGSTSASNVHIYKDGVEVSYVTTTDGDGSRVSEVKDIFIAKNAATNVSGYVDGLIDDVRIYNRALSADEIKRLYNIGR